MTTITPTFTDNVAVVALAALARGSTTRGTIDLRGKFGAYLELFVGRTGTAALTNGVDVLVRRVINNDSAQSGGMSAVLARFLSQTAAAISTTVNSDSNSGQAAVNVTSATSFAADDLILIQDAGGGTTRCEFQRLSKTATGIITCDRNLRYSHTAAQADTVRSKADAFGVWLPGGSLYEVVFDYGDDSAGDSVIVHALAQTYDSDAAA